MFSKVMGQIFVVAAKLLFAIVAILLAVVLLFMMLLFGVDWRIVFCLLPLLIVIVILVAAWCVTQPAVRKWILRSAVAVGVATALLLGAFGGVVIWENCVTVDDRGFSRNYIDDNIPFTDDGIENTPMFDLNGAPHIVTETSCYPLVSSIISSVYPKTEIYKRAQGDYGGGEGRYLRVNRSPSLFLERGESDIAIIRGEYYERDDLEQTMSVEVVALDAVVVFTYEDNAVTELTTEQLVNIFTGEVTDWSELGGGPQKILAYAANALNYSGKALREYLGTGITCYETHPEFILPYFTFVEQSTAYRNVKGAIGFTFLSNYDERYEGTRPIAIDGVLPNESTVADSSYPIVTQIVAATPKDRGEQTEKLLQWLHSEEGAALIEGAGLIPS